ncbi:hypothetical protein ACTNEF_09140 [Bariatricus sp. HCP28S3_E4]|uniref:hypothetical protein n=1 Tax=unclassified Bariatricus TaxID=2677046 RepID=UPI003F8C083F
MKKVRWIIISIVVLIVISITCAGIYFVNTPDYALMKIMKDVKESGMEGLSAHLTSNAQETLDTVSGITDNKLFTMVMGLLNENDYADVLKSKLQETEWEIEDILKSSDKATVILSFNYDERLIGTIEGSMIKENGSWKIDGLKFPKFDEINW